MLNPEDHCPKTLFEAIDLIFSNLTPEEFTWVNDNGAETSHHFFGRMIRNAWLWNKEHPLHVYFEQNFLLGHADDMSGLILLGVTARVRGTQFEPDKIAQEYRDYWHTMNIDPLTQQPVAA